MSLPTATLKLFNKFNIFSSPNEENIKLRVFFPSSSISVE